MGQNGCVVAVSRGSSRVRKLSPILLSAVMAAALPLSHAAAAVIVQQVEVGYYAGQPSYAPINFAGATTATSAQYPGITFNAQFLPNDTFSDHAKIVADNFYGPGSLGAGNISQVYNHSVINFDATGNAYIPGDVPFYYDAPIYNTSGQLTGYRDSVLHMRLGSSGPAPAPLAKDATGNTVNVRVTNHSYVLQFGSADVNKEAVRRADFLINRDNVVWVGGCANGVQFTGGGTGETTMAWQTRNGIAVRGNAPQSPFDPSLGMRGRRHADIWDGNLVSFSAGKISGAAAALINLAGANANMADARVIKSVMMTAADKVIHPGTFNQGGAAWQPSTLNNLDPGAGAGYYDHAAAVALLSAGEKTLATVPNDDTFRVNATALPTTDASGWSLGNAAAADSRAILVRFDKPVTNLAATLNWNVTSTGNATVINTTDAGLRFPDLSLALRPLSWNGTQYVVNTAVANTAGAAYTSDATGLDNDNVEHIYQTSGVLSPGTYALYIETSGSTFATPAALSYRTTALAGTVAATTSFTGPFGSNYAAPANWSGGVAPSGTSATATFAGTDTGIKAVVVSSNITLGTLSFTGSTPYALVVGGGTLTLSNGAFGPASVTVSSADQSISVPVITTGSLDLSIAAGRSLDLVSLRSAGTTTVSGGGRLLISDALRSTGTTALSIAAGSTVRLASPGLTSGNKVILEPTALSIGGTPASRGLLEVTGTSTPRTSNANLLRATSLTVANNGAALGSRTYYGFLDLGANDLVLSPGAAGYAAALASTVDLVKTWSHSGLNGLPGTTGLGSSLAHTSSPFTTLAVVGNNLSGNAFTALFDGVSVGLSDILIKYTYIGDLNLDGVVDSADFARLSQGLAGTGSGWSYGDINYDGVINGFDMLAMIESFRNPGPSLANLPPGLSSPSVPEPANALPLVPVISLLASRRRR